MQLRWQRDGGAAEDRPPHCDPGPDTADDRDGDAGAEHDEGRSQGRSGLASGRNHDGSVEPLSPAPRQPRGVATHRMGHPVAMTGTGQYLYLLVLLVIPGLLALLLLMEWLEDHFAQRLVADDIARALLSVSAADEVEAVVAASAQQLFARSQNLRR